AQVFYARQSQGIQIDEGKLGELIEKASADKYRAYNRIADATGVSPSGLNHRNVGPLLPSTDAAHLEPFVKAPNFLEYLRLAAENSNFARDLLTLVRAERDLKALARLRGSEGQIVKPEFQIMGTVTGRILVANPHLQQVRREYRRAIAPDEGKRLAYLDYAQFEPGILAALAEDEELIARYNQGDIYQQLSKSIFGTEQSRDLAKKMFLAFSYGMSSDRIVDLVGGTDQAAHLTAFDTFVAKFDKLAQFRIQSEADLQQRGFVETLFGNKRYRSGTGALTASDRRWAVSQRVQGTAALIFKEALLQIVAEFGPEGVMLPMHDAVLISLPHESYANDVSRIQDIMLSALKNRCPQIEGRVVAHENF
ncbi:MAG: DNA polymerase, partial [Pseudomonadota bacterium]